MNLQQIRDGHSQGRERQRRQREIIKILNTSATVIMHICTIIVANVQICILLEALMWSIFEVKCVNLCLFLLYKTLHPLMWML